jgi:hypothetical protein
MSPKILARGWESFDALMLSRVDEKRWRAEFEYRVGDGTKEYKSFEGTRAQIRADILAETDLSVEEQTGLLLALSLDEPVNDCASPTQF